MHLGREDNRTIYSYNHSYKCIFRCRKSKECGTCFADTKIEDSNENTDKKDADENGRSNPSDATDNKNGDNSGNKDAGNANPSGTSNNQTKEHSGANNNQSNYKVTVDSSVDTAAEEKKLAEQYKKENKTDDGATAQNGDTEKQGGGTEIAGIDEGIDADENTVGSNADTASEKSQSMSVWGIILLVVVAAIAGQERFYLSGRKRNRIRGHIWRALSGTGRTVFYNLSCL